MDNIIEEVTGSEYKYGFVTNVETDTIGKGLNEEVIRIISAKKEEPDWMLEFRLKAYRHWLISGSSEAASAGSAPSAGSSVSQENSLSA